MRSSCCPCSFEKQPERPVMKIREGHRRGRTRVRRADDDRRNARFCAPERCAIPIAPLQRGGIQKETPGHDPGFYAPRPPAIPIAPLHFMLSRWHKEAREGRLRGRGNVTLREMRDIRKLSGIERSYALLKEEHELLKKAIRFCSTRRPQWDEVLVAPTTSVGRPNRWPVLETGRRAGNVLASLGTSVRRLAATLFLLGASGSLRAQQPFLTDDPNVTARGKFHFESYNQFAVLSVIARPGLSQDTTNLVLQYGLLERVEANVDIPLLLLMNDRKSANAFGLGDLDFAVKVRLLDETPDRKSVV